MPRQKFFAIAKAALGPVLLSITGSILACSRVDDDPARFRPIEGRLIEFTHTEQRLSLSELARRLSTRVARSHKRQEDLPELKAVIALLVGNPQTAVDQLTRALEANPDQAELLSDLAAAHLELGRASEDPSEYFFSAQAAQRALRLNPSLLAARFNYALALNSLSLPRQAKAEWTRLLEDEANPKWITEVRSHLGQVKGERPSAAALLSVLDAPEPDREALADPVAMAPRLFREQVETVVLPAWGEAVMEGRPVEAEHGLNLARRVGELLIVVGGDPVISATVAHLERLRDASPTSVAEIAKGLRAYGEGHVHVAADRYDKAVERFRQAHQILSDSASPFAGWPTYHIAVCHYQHFKYAVSRAELQRLLGTIESSTQPALHGRSSILLGLIQQLEGDPFSALKSFESALDSFRRNREQKYQAKAMALMAHGFDYLGRPRQAWRWAHAALQVDQQVNEPTGRLVIFSTAAWLAQSQGAPEIALIFQDELLEAAKASGSDLAIADTLRVRASIWNALGDSGNASRDLREARAYRLELGDVEVLRGLEGDLTLIEAAGAPTPSQSLSKLDAAIETFRSTAYLYQLSFALFRRAQVHLSQERFLAAEKDMEQAISGIELQRSRLPDPQARISYFDQKRELLDSMIHLQMDLLGRPERALAYSERAKARVLWDWLAIQPTEPPSLPVRDEARSQSIAVDALKQDLPAKTLVVEYALLPDSLVIWTVQSSKELTSTSANVGTDAILDQVKGFREAILIDDRQSAAERAEQLYDLLIRPWVAHLDGIDHLVFVPDRSLHGLPFSILQDRLTGRRLFEDYAISMAPSLGIYVTTLRRGDPPGVGRSAIGQEPEEALASPAPRALVVTSPSFDQSLHALPRLSPGSLAAAFDELFPGSLALSGEQATRPALVRHAGRFEIVHFGGHSVVNVDYPLLSYLLLAPTPDHPSGTLYSGDVLGEVFPATQLVVLASCNSGSGRVSRTEGVESLARSFLAAGVPGVVGSLWPVEDRSTNEFFEVFYRHLATTGEAARALQATQIELSREGDPRTWGAFVSIGSGRVDPIAR